MLVASSVRESNAKEREAEDEAVRRGAPQSKLGDYKYSKILGLVVVDRIAEGMTDNVWYNSPDLGHHVAWQLEFKNPIPLRAPGGGPDPFQTSVRLSERPVYHADLVEQLVEADALFHGRTVAQVIA